MHGGLELPGCDSQALVVSLGPYNVTNEAAEAQTGCDTTQAHTAETGQIGISWLAVHASRAVSCCLLV